MKTATFRIGLFFVLCFAVCATTRAAEKHPYGADAWSSLRSAGPVAVAPDGDTILYRVDFGGLKGRENHEWRVIRAAGSGGHQLKLPQAFDPFGFHAAGTHV